MHRKYMNRLMKFVLCSLVLAALKVAGAQNLVLRGAKVYPSPTGAPIEGAVVFIDHGKISGIVQGHVKYDVPKGTQTLDCTGKVVVAGFWNSHVHFTEALWSGAGTVAADKLEAHMQEMLTRWGFTTVWDLGSNPDDTMMLRKRVESGEVPGPRILMAGDIFPKGGHPAYVPAEIQLPEAATPQEAERLAQGYMKMGLDGMKLFTGSYMGPDKPVVNMDTAIAKAAVDVAHAEGKPAFAHPQNYTGVNNALNAGVDVLAHTIPTENGYTADELAQMKRQHTALTPTLTLWTTVTPSEEAQKYLVQSGVEELKAFAANGGPVLFGTDVGFITKYDTTEEFEYMGRALDWKQVLASLTTNPAEYFKAKTKGRVERDMDADLVVLDGDPAVDVKNLAKVKYTVRGGKVIYQEK
jgi:imidazolonepropionase-like amidohydrolase